MHTLKKNIITTIIMCCLSNIITLNGNGSFVYNLRIAETTKRQPEMAYLKPSLGSATFVDQFRKRHNDIDENIVGGLFSLVYFPRNFYMRMDWAFAHIALHTNAFDDARTQSDDILLSTGYSFKTSKKTKTTFSGLLGIPTHNDNGFLRPQFGTGHVGLGGQIDGIYNYKPRFSLRYAARSIHFFHNVVDIEINNNAKKFNFTPGNLTDLLISQHFNFGKKRFEFGYNASFLTNSSLTPKIEIIEDQIRYIRHNFYGSFLYGFLLGKLISGIVVGMSYGFDSSPKLIGLKRILTLWAAWGLNF